MMSLNNKSLSFLLAGSLLATQALCFSLSMPSAMAKSQPPEFMQDGRRFERFRCERIPYNEKQVWATVGYRDDERRTPPMITWERRDFEESGYTPERRCQKVTSKLNQVLSPPYRGYPGELWLTSGKVNRLTVICYVRSQDSGCNQSNVLVTISPNSPSSQNPDEALRNIIDYSLTGSGTPLQESRGQLYFRMSDLFEAGSGTQNAPSDSRPSPSSPLPRESQPETPPSTGGWGQ